MAMKVVTFLVSRDAMNEEERKKLNQVYKEIETLKELEHRNIVKYYGISENDSSISIFTEFMGGGTIKDLILKKEDALDKKIISKYCKQILEALVYIHKKKIVHRDLNDENILLDKDYRNFKLADFGISKKLCQGLVARPCVVLWILHPRS